MRVIRLFLFSLLLVLVSAGLATAASLPFETVFKGGNNLISWSRKRRTTIGNRSRSASGPPPSAARSSASRYKSFTLEIDDRIEAPSANFYGMDCWTFFEIALGFARMLEEPGSNWTPARFLHYIELDRYRGGECTGEYLSRLHYLEDWLADNDRRGLVNDLTRELGGVRANHAAHEMTFGWRHYRYLKANPALLAPLGADGSPGQSIGRSTKSRKAASRGSNQGSRAATSLGSFRAIGPAFTRLHMSVWHYRTNDGVLHFMHASSPRNYGKVVIDSRLSSYLARYRSDSGILVARPLK